ncbi:hypothetical protein Tco_1225485 [Tanacetum coccineum]
MSVPFVHRTLVVNVLALMDTILYLLHRYYSLPLEETCCSLLPDGTSCSLPPEETGYSLPPEEISYSLPLEGTSCSLPLEETSYSLPPERTSCSLPLEETSYSLVIASGHEVAFITLAIPVDHDAERYMWNYEAYEQFHSMSNQEAGGSGSGIKRTRTYISREREEAEQRLLDGDDETPPKYRKKTLGEGIV